MSRVLLVNWAGVNSGDDFICEVLVNRLGLLYPDWELHLLSEGYVEAVSDRIELARWRPFFNALRSLAEFRAMCSEIYEADRILIGGGDIVRPEFLSVLPLLIAVILRKPVALVGVGVVAANSMIWRGIYRVAMTVIDFALVRDLPSQRALQASSSCDVKVAPDLVFGPMVDFAAERRSSDKCKDIVVNLRSVTDHVYSRLLNAGDMNHEKICAALAQALFLFSASKAYHIVLLPMVDDNALARGYPELTSDLTILRILRDRLPSHLQVTLLNCRPRCLAELRTIYSNAAIVIAMRLHALVPALAWGVPVVAVPYASKVGALQEVFHDLISVPLARLANGDSEGIVSAMQAAIDAAPDWRLSEKVGRQSNSALEVIFHELSLTGRAKPLLTSLFPMVASLIALLAFFIKTFCNGDPNTVKPARKARTS